MSELAHPHGTAPTVEQRLPRDGIHEPLSAQARPRPVIVHYHLFKNAGTSVDRTLQENFGSGWAAMEADGPSSMLAPWKLRALVAANPSVTVVSSHTLDLPPPAVPGVTLVPIIFVRHPLDRIRSMYEFELQQRSDSLGSLKAKETDLAGYIRWRLERAQLSAPLSGGRSGSDFQTHRLARGMAGRSPLRRAMRMVDALSFVGLVEAYVESIARLQAVLASHFPAVELRTFRENPTTDEEGALEERLAKLRASIGDDLFERLSVANRDDLTLWAAIRERYESSSGVRHSR